MTQSIWLCSGPSNSWMSICFPHYWRPLVAFCQDPSDSKFGSSQVYILNLALIHLRQLLHLPKKMIRESLNTSLIQLSIGSADSYHSPFCSQGETTDYMAPNSSHSPSGCWSPWFRPWPRRKAHSTFGNQLQHGQGLVPFSDPRSRLLLILAATFENWTELRNHLHCYFN